MIHGRDHWTIKLPILDPRSTLNAICAWKLASYGPGQAFDDVLLLPEGLIPVGPASGRSLRKAVHELAKLFRREFGYDFVQWSVKETNPRTEAFLWCSESWSFQVPLGAVCFRWREWKDAPAGWSLDWIWMHPFERRHGHLSTAWPFFSKLYGDFHVAPSLSPAMSSFVEKQKVASAPIMVSQGGQR
jgi:hypothetical protein